MAIAMCNTQFIELCDLNFKSKHLVLQIYRNKIFIYDNKLLYQLYKFV